MRVYSKKHFTYNGEELEQGQCFELIGARNDQKLLGLNFCEPVSRRTEVLNCGCGKSFVGERQLRVHQEGDKHPKKPIVLSAMVSK